MDWEFSERRGCREPPRGREKAGEKKNREKKKWEKNREKRRELCGPKLGANPGNVFPRFSPFHAPGNASGGIPEGLERPPPGIWGHFGDLGFGWDPRKSPGIPGGIQGMPFPRGYPGGSRVGQSLHPAGRIPKSWICHPSPSHRTEIPGKSRGMRRERRGNASRREFPEESRNSRG